VSRKRSKRYSIKNPHSLRKGADKNARKVDSQFKNLIEQKKNQIRSMVEDLGSSKDIIYHGEMYNSKRAVSFELSIVGKIIQLQFIIWTDNRRIDYDLINSQRARFILELTKNIENTKFKVLRYLESIKTGCITEYLYKLALEELEQERKIHSFYKTGKAEDIRKKDFVIKVLKDGILINLYLQVKSSKDNLMAEKKDLLGLGIAGSYYKFTGDLRGDTDNIKMKIMRIVENYKEGRINFE